MSAEPAIRTESTNAQTWGAEQVQVFNFVDNVFNLVVPDAIISLEPSLAEEDDLRDAREAMLILELSDMSTKAGIIDYREYQRQRSGAT